MSLCSNAQAVANDLEVALPTRPDRIVDLQHIASRWRWMTRSVQWLQKALPANRMALLRLRQTRRLPLGLARLQTANGHLMRMMMTTCALSVTTNVPMPGALPSPDQITLHHVHKHLLAAVWLLSIQMVIRHKWFSRLRACSVHGFLICRMRRWLLSASLFASQLLLQSCLQNMLPPC